MTLTKSDCVKSLQDQGLDLDEATQIVEELIKDKQRIAAETKLADATAQLAESWTNKTEAARRAAIHQKRITALNIIHRKRLDQAASVVKNEGYDFADFLEASLVGSPEKFTGSRVSVSAKKDGIVHSWVGGMANDLEKIDGAQELISSDMEFSYQTVREIMEPGSTGDKTAAAVAETMVKYSELSRQRLNKAGADIGKLEGRVPRAHDTVRMLSADNGGQEGWVEFVKNNMDIERSFPSLVDDPDGLDRALNDIFETIATGRDKSLSARQQGLKTGPANLAKSMGASRVLHFADANAEIAYHQRYGSGNVFYAMVSELDSSARKLALMETFGPNPEVMVKSLIDTEISNIRKSNLDIETKEKKIRELERGWTRGLGETGKYQRWYAEVSGSTFSPVNVSAAKISSTIRAVQSGAKLGGAFLSAFADVFVKANAIRHRGKNLFDAWSGAVKFMTERGTTEERRRTARRLGAFVDASLGSIMVRFNPQDQVRGRAADMLDTMFKYSGLTGWTEGHKAGFIYALSSDLGEESGKAFGSINRDLQVVLKRSGIDEKTWEAVRKMTEKTEDGFTHVIPDKAYQLSTADLLPLIDESLRPTQPQKGRSIQVHQAARKQALERAQRDLENKVMSLYADECKYAIIEPDDRTRSAMVWGTRPGTFMGESLRFMSQFKSFPIAYYQRIIREQRWTRAADTKYTQKLLGLSHFTAAALAFGYMSMTAKDLVRGKEPKDPRKAETWFAAAVQSGGAGIFGDFLFGKVNRVGSSFLETLAGPTAGTVGKVVGLGGQLIRGEVEDVAADSARLVVDNTPFVNLWYTRMALDYALLFHIREMLSPGTLRRTERRIKKDYGQEYFIKPSSVIKRGGGFR